MVYHLDGYWFPIAKPMVDVGDENEVKRRVGRQANRQSTVDLGHLAPLLFCWAAGSCWAPSPEHFLLTRRRKQVLTASEIVKMEGPSGSYGRGKVPESCYLTLSLPTFSTGPRNFFPSHSFLLMPSLLHAHAFNEVTILGLHH